MSVDVKCYALAKVWLLNSGWNNDATIAELAQKIQDTIEDYEADLEHETVKGAP
jgi:hypothetical protein